MLDIFALIVLLVLLAAAIAAWVALGMMPGRIARRSGEAKMSDYILGGRWKGYTPPPLPER